MKIIQIFYNILHKESDLLTSCQSLTICKKIVFYQLKFYSFPKNYFYFWNILKKWHWFWPPPPLLKCHSYSHIQNLIFFWDPPLFAQCHSFYWFFFLKSSLTFSFQFRQQSLLSPFWIIRNIYKQNIVVVKPLPIYKKV